MSSYQSLADIASNNAPEDPDQPAGITYYKYKKIYDMLYQDSI